MSEKFSDFFNEQMKDPEFAAAYYNVSKEEDARLMDALKREHEHQRLKDAVVAAARDWLDYGKDVNDQLYIALAALRDFEFEREQGDKS